MSDTTESTALALIPPSALPTILAADGDDILGALRKKLAGYAPDATTQGGRAGRQDGAHCRDGDCAGEGGPCPN